MKKIITIVIFVIAGCTSDDDQGVNIPSDYTTNEQLLPLQAGKSWKYVRFDNSKQQPDTIVVETLTKRIGLYQRIDSSNALRFIDSATLYTLTNTTPTDYDLAAMGQYVRTDSGLASVDLVQEFYLYTQVQIPKKITNNTVIMFKGYAYKATVIPEFVVLGRLYSKCWQFTPVNNPNLSRKIFSPGVGLLEERFIENGDTVCFKYSPF